MLINPFGIKGSLNFIMANAKRFYSERVGRLHGLFLNGLNMILLSYPRESAGCYIVSTFLWKVK